MTRYVLKIPVRAWLLQTAAGSALGRMVIRLGQQDGFRTINIVRRREQAEEKRNGAHGQIVKQIAAFEEIDVARRDQARLGDEQRIERTSGRSHGAVLDRDRLGGEGAEQAIPHDQRPGEVAIQVGGVATMVDAVVRRRR